MKFFSRPYKDGDALAINQLYFEVTGRQRTIEQHAWQWLQSPAGIGEMWLIEYENEEGQRKLIGHHGVMAELFTFFGKEIIVGKTENTMILPEFRENILYLRYEKEFLNNYKKRFGAIFSTFGPKNAIKMRAALGYKNNIKWENTYIGYEPLVSLSLIFNRIKLFKINVDLDKISYFFYDGFDCQVLDGEKNIFDFDSFWGKISKDYELTPARTKANLSWRFWTNPYHKYKTLKISHPENGVFIAIIYVNENGVICVDDIFLEKKCEISKFLIVFNKWIRREIRFPVIKFLTTNDNFFYENCDIILKYTLISKFKKIFGINLNELYMPRKIIDESLNNENGDDYAWYVTGFYLEGR